MNLKYLSVRSLASITSLLLASAALAQSCTPHWQGLSLNGHANILYVDTASQSLQLLIGGAFTSPAYIARFTGTSFTSIAPGLNGEVMGITRHDDGSGSALYVTGFVDVPLQGSWNVSYARLQNAAFQSFGSSNGPGTWSGPAVSYNLGHGPKFLTSGGFGFPCDYVTEWNGTTWECLGQGLGSVIHDACIYDDGSGPALYCVGSLIVNDFPFQEGVGIGRWNGAAWSTVGGIGGGYGQCCTVHDDGSGPELFIGGSFIRVGTSPSVPAANIAKWNGHRWAPLASGTNQLVRAITPFNDGSGMKLYAAGDFSRAGTATVQRLARWDGSTWSACLAGGLPSGTINDMLAFDPDDAGPLPPYLCVAGSFSSVAGGTVLAANFAVLHSASPTADFNHDNITDFFDYLDFVAAFSSSLPAADFNTDGAIDFFDYLDFIQAFSSGC